MKPNMNPTMNPVPTPKRGRMFLPVLLFVLLLGALAGAGYLYRRVKALEQNPQTVVQEEVKSLVDTVGKLMVLPDGETPTIATVTDPEKLKDQAFFANAQKGYRVLIYANARKAILYDPAGNKIVDIAPINIGNETTAKTSGSVSGASTSKTNTTTTTTSDTKNDN
jgi:hypothetical protein